MSYNPIRIRVDKDPNLAAEIVLKAIQKRQRKQEARRT